MNLVPILAQTATFLDASMVQSLSFLFGSLAAAGTFVAITRWYVGHLTSRAERERRILEDFNISHAEIQRKFQEQLDRLSDRNLEAQQDFQAYVSLMSDISPMILRDVIVTMKTIEKIGGGSTVTSYGLETTISSVQPTVRANDDPCRETADGDF